MGNFFWYGYCKNLFNMKIFHVHTSLLTKAGHINVRLFLLKKKAFSSRIVYDLKH